MMLVRWSLALLLSLCALRPVSAEDPLASSATPPQVISVGVYLNQITQVDLKAGTFCADFWLWFRWTGDPDLNPIESFEIIGGEVESKNNVATKHVNGVHYTNGRIKAVVQNRFDVSRYPLDDHRLSIVIEEATRESKFITYQADVANCGQAEGVQVPGWNVVRTPPEVMFKNYTTTFGDPEADLSGSSTYSRFTYHVDLVRPSSSYAVKLFWSLHIAAIIAWLSFLVPAAQLDARIALGSGALFAAIATAFIIASNLPETGQVTIADWVNSICVLFIFSTLVITWWSNRRFEQGHEVAAKRLDHRSALITALLYVLANILVFVF